MISFQKPSTDLIRGLIDKQSKLDFSYSAIGATGTTPPVGFVIDRTRIKLGEGESAFQSGIAALQRWDHFKLDWVEAWPSETLIKPGEVVAVMGRGLGLWWLNCCRLVYTVNESGLIKKFGFAYGTLPGHIESGEERFLIEWDQSDNGVWYDILAFSRPNHLLIRLGYPLVRRLQKKFGRDSAMAVFEAVNGTTSIPEIRQG